jgi:hypothetical protein
MMVLVETRDQQAARAAAAVVATAVIVMIVAGRVGAAVETAEAVVEAAMHASGEIAAEKGEERAGRNCEETVGIGIKIEIGEIAEIGRTDPNIAGVTTVEIVLETGDN